MIFPCKDYPDKKGEPDWCAALKIRISNPTKHSPPSRPFEVLVDTGASRCIFHADIGRSLGFDIGHGEEENTIEVSGEPTKLYLHRVSIYVLGGIETITAGFCHDLPLAGLLGRRGFLDRFRFTFDCSTIPPQFELTKLVRV